MQFSFTEVPPPTVAPVHQIAETLGLCDGLRAERNTHQYRCGQCHQMQQNGAWGVWVPDGVRVGDPSWSVTESARRNAYNGTFTTWCLDCALRLSPPKAAPIAPLVAPPGGPYAFGAALARLWCRLIG